MMAYAIRGWVWAIPMIVLVVLTGAVAFGLGMARGAQTRRAEKRRTPPDALGELQLRLARGDITPDDYEELRAHLRE